MENTTKNDFLSGRLGLVLAALLCNLLWGSASPCIKLGYRFFDIAPTDEMSQILFAGLRFALAGLMTILLGSLPRRRLLLPKKGSGGMLVTLALVQTVIQYIFFYLGLARAPGFKGSIISPSGIFFALLVSALLFHQEKLSWRKLLGCVVGFGGVVLVNLGRSTGGEAGFRLNGEGFILLSTLSFAFSSVFIKRFSEREDPVALSGWQFVLGGSVMILVGLLFGGRLHIVSAAAIPLLLYLALVSAVAYTLSALLLQRHPVSRVTVFNFCNPPFGVFLSALLLDEAKLLNPLQILGALLLVSLGVWIVNSPGKNERLAV